MFKIKSAFVIVFLTTSALMSNVLPAQVCTGSVLPGTVTVTVVAGGPGVSTYVYGNNSSSSGCVQGVNWFFNPVSWPAELSWTAQTFNWNFAVIYFQAGPGVPAGLYQAPLSHIYGGSCLIGVNVVPAPCTAAISPASWSPQVVTGGAAAQQTFATLPVTQAGSPAQWSFIPGPAWPAGLMSLIANTGTVSADLAVQADVTVAPGTYAGNLRRTGACNGNLAIVLDVAVSVSVFPPPAATPPALTSVTPASGPTTGGTTVMITGTDFHAVSQVWFGDEPATSVTFQSPTQLQVVTPFQVSRTCLPVFAVAVRVVNGPGMEGSLDPGFTYLPPSIRHVGPGQAFGSIQTAIAASQDGDAVVIHPEIVPGLPVFYQETLDTIGKAILITSSDPAVLPYISPASATARVLTVASGEGRHTVVTCVQLASGGGGLLVDNASSPTIIHCEIHDHTTPDDGGGVLIRGGSSPLLQDNRIHTNSGANGGGIAVLGGTSVPRLANNQIVGNHASGDGGGVYLAPGVPVAGIDGSAMIPGWGRGEVRANTAQGRGGGVFCGLTTGLARRFAGLDVISNTAGSHGGGIYLASNTAGEVQGCVVAGNLSPDDGGGIHLAGVASVPIPSHSVIGNRIEGNEAQGRGGGVFAAGGAAILIQDNQITDNNPDRLFQGRFHLHGGGIACDGTTASGTSVTIRGNRIERNRSDGPCGRGGGIWIAGTPATPVIAVIEDNTVHANESQVAAGIMLDTKVFAILRRNFVVFNQVSLLCTQVPPCPDLSLNPTALHCPWQGAAPAPDVIAPGVMERDCQITLLNNTFHGNSGGNTTAHGGGLHAKAGMFGSSSVRNNIFSQNAGSGMYLDGTASAFPVRYNDFFNNGQGPCGPPSLCALDASNILLDPLFVDLSAVPYDLGLQAGSPCNDAGDPATPVPAGGGTRVDIGAAESGGAPSAGLWIGASTQPNSARASLVVNGVGAAAAPGPFTVPIPASGAPLTLTFGGSAGQPFLLAAGTLNPGHLGIPGMGRLDIGTPPAYPDFVVVFNGLQPGSPFHLDAAGDFQMSIVLPPLPPGILASIQGAVLQPAGGPDPIVLTAAFSLFAN